MIVRLGHPDSFEGDPHPVVVRADSTAVIAALVMGEVERAHGPHPTIELSVPDDCSIDAAVSAAVSGFVRAEIMALGKRTLLDAQHAQRNAARGIVQDAAPILRDIAMIEGWRNIYVAAGEPEGWDLGESSPDDAASLTNLGHTDVRCGELCGRLSWVAYPSVPRPAVSLGGF